MAITRNDIAAFAALRRNGPLTVADIAEEIGRAPEKVRERMRAMAYCGLVFKLNPPEGLTLDVGPAVWDLTRSGSAELMRVTGDPRDRVEGSKRVPRTGLRHVLAASRLAMTIRRAFAAQSVVTLERLIPWRDLTPLAIDEGTRRTVWRPDLAFEARVGGCRKAFYVEAEGSSCSPRQTVAYVRPGYEAVLRRGLWAGHFPEAESFRVLFFARSADWRDAMARAARVAGCGENWLFVSQEDVSPETLLTVPIFRDRDGVETTIINTSVTNQL